MMLDSVLNFASMSMRGIIRAARGTGWPPEATAAVGGSALHPGRDSWQFLPPLRLPAGFSGGITVNEPD